MPGRTVGPGGPRRGESPGGGPGGGPGSRRRPRHLVRAAQGVRPCSGQRGRQEPAEQPPSQRPQMGEGVRLLDQRAAEFQLGYVRGLREPDVPAAPFEGQPDRRVVRRVVQPGVVGEFVVESDARSDGAVPGEQAEQERHQPVVLETGDDPAVLGATRSPAVRGDFRATGGRGQGRQEVRVEHVERLVGARHHLPVQGEHRRHERRPVGDDPRPKARHGGDLAQLAAGVAPRLGGQRRHIRVERRVAEAEFGVGQTRHGEESGLPQRLPQRRERIRPEVLEDDRAETLPAGEVLDRADEQPRLVAGR